MAICRIRRDDGTPEYALFDSGRVCPLSRLIDDAPACGELFVRGSKWIDSLPKPSEDQWQDAPSTLLSPIPTPGKVICIGLNYRDHAIETGKAIPSEPLVFSKFGSAVIGHGDKIVLPKVSSKVDYEAELVVVIGKEAKHVSASEAMNCVFGYTCGHDVSARDWQIGKPGGQWLLGKTFDTFAPMGPCLVTPHEIPDPSNLRVRMHLNGEVVQESTTAQLIFSIGEVIAHISQIFTLSPGDVIFTGTPPGVGVARKPPVFLQPNDRCEVEIEGIGTLANQCEAETSRVV